ncbi:MAG TPA: hypothetical protein VII41_12755 [Steroidobacteraceae bacterium]
MAMKRQSVRSRIAWIVVPIAIIAYCSYWTYAAYVRFGEQLSILDGIGLGRTRGEIRYILGDPPVVYSNEAPGESGNRILYTDRAKDPTLPAGTDIESYRTWLYDNGSSLDPHLDITFDPNSGRATKIDCVDQSDPPSGYCSRLLGAGIGDGEYRVIALLGVPTRQSIDDKSGVKTMIYDDIGVVLLLARQRVFALSVIAASAPRPLPLDRFLVLVANDLRTVFKL